MPFNAHFKKAGHIFDEHDSLHGRTHSHSQEVNSPVFDLASFLVSEVLHGLHSIDPKKSAGPNGLNPFFLKIAAQIIAQPVTDIFNLSLSKLLYRPS